MDLLNVEMTELFMQQFLFSCFQATNLDVNTAEELQVVNYGLGGHYEPHFDFARVSYSLLANISHKTKKQVI